jgi:hypothetical protein
MRVDLHRFVIVACQQSHDPKFRIVQEESSDTDYVPRVIYYI